ncbi:MAG: DegQ family serine endoprotease [Planctomycetota bacterium]
MMSSAARWAIVLALPHTLAATATAEALSAPPERVERAIALADDLSLAFSHAADEIRPSVVSINAVKRVRVAARSPMSPFQNDPFFERFFGQMPERQPREREFEQRGAGTGFIVREDGYIVTNNHVVEGADELLVRMADGRELNAEIVGTDPQTDLAVIRVDETRLPAAELSESGSLRVGQWVVAAGNPLELSHTVTAGIVSATGRSGVGLTAYEDFIQTDAAINPGNSGGPLVNLRGRVVGVNTAIATRSGGFMGIGFAIPIEMARPIVESLIDGEPVARGYLGIVPQDLTAELAESFGFESTSGVLVGDVSQGTPAEAAGVLAGDIITELDGRPVADANQLRARIASKGPGVLLGMTVYRDGERLELSATLGDRSELVVEAESAVDGRLGLTLSDADAETRERFNLGGRVTGAVITEVTPGGPADQLGLRAGDVIIAVNRDPVNDASELRSTLAALDLDRGVRLAVRRGDVQRFVFFRLAD